MTARRLLYTALLIAIPLVAINAIAFVAIRVAAGVTPLDRVAYLARKSAWIRNERPEVYPHPFVGQVGSADEGTGSALSASEPLYAARPSRTPDRPVKVLVVGGSVARHLSRNEAADSVGAGGTRVGAADLLEQALNDAFNTDRFTVFNAATGGGKQPQQLFRLQYLLLLGERFDVVVNVDGFNEIALPLIETTPLGLPGVVPRAYPQLLRSPFIATQCVAASNEAVRAYSVLPMVELWRLIRIRRCVRHLDRPPTEDSQAIVAAWRGEFVTTDSALPALAALWARSSEALEQLALGAGATYLHVLQPTQHFPESKPLSAEERRVADDDFVRPYQEAIAAHYGRLRIEDLRVRHKADLRQIFQSDTSTLYRDACCHLNNRGMRLLAEAIVSAGRTQFAAALAKRD
jgi:hypothetical protein